MYEKAGPQYVKIFPHAVTKVFSNHLVENDTEFISLKKNVMSVIPSF